MMNSEPNSSFNIHHSSLWKGFIPTMKSFNWRVLLHTVPVIVGLVIVAFATNSYIQGTGGFKLGVDLVGGTILVYEVDPSKPKRPDYSPEKLAAALKKRIDPADLYNVTIRPVGENRVEIILPTGGYYQNKRAEEAWQQIVNETKQKFGVEDADIKVARDQPEQFISEIEKAVKTKTPAGLEGGSETPEVKESDIRAFVQERYAANEKKFLTGENVKEIQERIRQVGSLEFRVLANN